MRNLIQVFGLPKSGTNFIEWMLINNFSNIKYKNIYVKENIISYPTINNTYILKHSYPNLKYSEFAIVVYKSFNDWCKSMKKAYPESKPTKKTYNKYLNKSKELSTDKVLIVDYLYAYQNYEELIFKISKMIKVKPNNKIIKPKNRLNRGGASVKETNEKFKL